MPDFDPRDIDELRDIYDSMTPLERFEWRVRVWWVVRRPTNWWLFWTHFIGGFVLLYLVGDEKQLLVSLLFGLTIGYAAGRELFRRKDTFQAHRLHSIK